MNWRALWCAVAVTAGAGGVAAAQDVDSAAAAVGIYRPVLPTDTMRQPGTPPDSVSRDSALRDTLLRGTQVPDSLAPGRSGADSLADTTRADSLPASTRVDAARADSLARADTSATKRGKQNALQPAEERDVDDTSLTARMDATRGGGLRRADYLDLLNTAKMSGSYRTFIALIDRSPLGRLLTGGTGVTILAPNDSAFAKLPPAELARLRNNASARDAWLGTLIFKGDMKSSDFAKAGDVRSRGGTVVHFSSAEGGVRAGQAALVQPNLVARNGIFHGIDRAMVTGATSATP
jgi:uncharacterized surface protein with fasciclin (FAS1) repeats